MDPNGQLMVNLIPELELIIGKQPPVPQLARQDAQNRFDTVLRRFLGTFARQEHPLAWFVDDLQWVDPASRKLLEQFVTHPDIRHLLLIGAYRDNEVTAGHPLRLTLDAIRQTEALVREIVLKPLSLADVTELISDALRCEPGHAHPLAKLVLKKTGGNPFFAIQFLTTLAEERLLGFDARGAAWKWDLNRIRAKGFTDNVVELMIRKLKRLPAPTREAHAALECLRLFGIEMRAHPTREEVQAEYELIWSHLADRPIESLVDLPLMTNPEMHAAMRVLAFLTGPALYTDINLYHWHFCKMVNLSLRNGISDASTFGYAGLGVMLCVPWQRYAEGYRFGKLACDLVEKHGFAAYKAKVYLSMEMVALWSRPIELGIKLIRAAFRAGAESGDLSFACYGCMHLITNLLIQGAPLDEVWRESEACLDFVRQGKYLDAVDAIICQQQFIRTLRGQTANFSTFSDQTFDATGFEARLTEDRMTSMVSRYWILKVEARFLSGDYHAGLAAAEKAKKVHWSSAAFLQSLDYYYYTALNLAAVYEAADPGQRAEWLDALRTSLNQLRVWTEHCPSTFLDKHALIAAELARLEGRDRDAMRLYEAAIRAARENGLVQNEGIGNEVAARYYLARGIEKVAHAYLREARYCYVRWGALGKVHQLDQRYPALGEQAAARPATSIGTSLEQLDLGTVMKASQAVAGELVLEKLIQTLMAIALQHAGAERGLLILPRGEGHRIEAEARTRGDGVAVCLRQSVVTPGELPESLLRHVIRTQQSVILEDASVQNLFSEDEFVRQQRAGLFRGRHCRHHGTQAG